MNNDHSNIIKLQSRFLGVKEGFKFLNSFLDVLKNNKNLKKNITLYDYRYDVNFGLSVNHQEFQKFFQNFYLEFLIKEKFQKYFWYNNFCQKIYIMFSKNLEESDVFADLIIRFLTKAFLYFSNNDNLIFLENLKAFLCLEFNNLQSNHVESTKYANSILNSLISCNLLIKKGEYVSINDRFIFLDFLITSLEVVPIFPNNQFDLKYGCLYAFENLPNVIDFFLFNLKNNDSFIKSEKLFSLDKKYVNCFPFLTNYDQINFLDIPIMESPFDKLFNAFFLKKLTLNEYCFQTIITSCFEYYYFKYETKNILMEKANLSLNFIPNYNYYFHSR